MAINQVAVSHTTLRNEADAGLYLATQVIEKLGGDRPDVVIVFASPEFDYVALLQAIEAGCTPGIIVGCSSAGEFSGCNDSNASVSLMAIRAEDMLFNAALGKGIAADRLAALDQIMPAFTGAQHRDFPL